MGWDGTYVGRDRAEDYEERWVAPRGRAVAPQRQELQKLGVGAGLALLGGLLAVLVMFVVVRTVRFVFIALQKPRLRMFYR